MLLVNTAARTKWPDSEDNKRRSSKTDGLFLIELPDAARSKLVTWWRSDIRKQLWWISPFNCIHLLGERSLSRKEMQRFNVNVEKNGLCFNLQVATWFIQCFLVGWRANHVMAVLQEAFIWPPKLSMLSPQSVPNCPSYPVAILIGPSSCPPPHRPLLTAEHLIPPLISLDCSQCFFCFDVWLFRPFVFLS